MEETKTEPVAVSSFAQRLDYARDRQRSHGTWQEDRALAALVGVTKSQLTAYKARDEAPPAKRTLALAQECDVDPGWLAFGENSKAPAPDGFATWLENKRAAESRPIRVVAGSKLPAFARSSKRARKGKRG